MRLYILGVSFENAKNAREVQTIKTQSDLPSMEKVSKYIMVLANPRFFQKETKNSLWRFLVTGQQNVTRVKLGPGTYLPFLLPRMLRACTHKRLCIQPTPGKIYRFCNSLKAFLSLNLDKSWFRIILVFFVRIFFILLLSKWSEMDPNVKPQTLVQTFDHANSNSVPEYTSSPCNFVHLSCVDMHSWASLQRYEETANSFTKDHDRR